MSRAPVESCQCRSCDCDATTAHPSIICYLCRGGAGVALVPFPPAHHVGAYQDRLEAIVQAGQLAAAGPRRVGLDPGFSGGLHDRPELWS